MAVTQHLSEKHLKKKKSQLKHFMLIFVLELFIYVSTRHVETVNILTLIDSFIGLECLKLTRCDNSIP